MINPEIARKCTALFVAGRTLRPSLTCLDLWGGEGCDDTTITSIAALWPLRRCRYPEGDRPLESCAEAGSDAVGSRP